jgi:hypothetical protein
MGATLRRIPLRMLTRMDWAPQCGVRCNCLLAGESFGFACGSSRPTKLFNVHFIGLLAGGRDQRRRLHEYRGCENSGH